MNKRDFLKLAAIFAASAVASPLFATGEKPKKRALLVIDMQNEYFAGGALPVTYPHNSHANILSAIKAAKSANIPIVTVQHTATAKGAKAFVKGTHG